MAREFTRIFSDIHFGERAGRVRELAQLRPLFDGPASVIINGDTMDTRRGPYPELTAQQRREVEAFFTEKSVGVPCTLLTGNHDPDISQVHRLELADGEIFLTHGDLCFGDVVPWSQDAPIVRQRFVAALAALPPGAEATLDGRLLALRRAVATMTQRHQAERNFLRFVVRYAQDSVWPPDRLFRVLRTWRELPGRAEALAQRFRPQARFILVGHTHRPGAWPTPSGTTVINTGAFAIGARSIAVDVFSDQLVLRRIEAAKGGFRTGATVAEFALAGPRKPSENTTA